ncbi:MAG TPA: transposase [Urbifossiella sp.]|jgi:REP element-mobilizing transposase RayT|nr:transposase [Urbifossiella sp.]
MDRVWFLTWTTYGTWLPGDERGFVSNVRDDCGPEVRHNKPGTPCDAKLRGLANAARSQLNGPPVFLIEEQANTILPQLRETATYRNWTLFAAAIMANHIHLVLGVVGDPDPALLLRDFKSYASRSLNRTWPRPASGTWWTENGSKRKVKDDAGLIEVIGYVRDQPFAFVAWMNDEAIGTTFDLPVVDKLLKNQGADAPRSPGALRSPNPPGCE